MAINLNQEFAFSDQMLSVLNLVHWSISYFSDMFYEFCTVVYVLQTLHQLTARAIIRDWTEGSLDTDRTQHEVG